MHTSAVMWLSSARQRWFVLALLLLFLAVSVQYCVKVAGHSERANRSAILRWRDPLHHLGDENIYEHYNYPNPPIMALLLEPVAQLPPLASSLCFFYLKVVLTLIAIPWVFWMVECPERPFPPAAKAVAILLSLRPILGDLVHANVNLIILFFVVAALYAWARGRSVTAGIMLALGIACKVTPALFVPYFIWKRAWNVLAGTAAGLVLFLFVVPGLALGNQRNLDLLKSWVNQMVTPYVVAGEVTTELTNQSLPGLVFRLTTHNPSLLDEKGKPQRYDNLLTLDQRMAGWLVKGCMALFAGVIVWSCRTPRDVRQGWRAAAEFSLVALGMLLFSERTWKHHCVTLVLPFAVLCYYLAVLRPARTLRCYLLGTLAAALLLMLSTSTIGVREDVDHWGKMAQVYGAYVWADLLLVSALVVVLKQGARDEERGSREESRAEAEVATLSPLSCALAPRPSPLAPPPNGRAVPESCPSAHRP
jgi:hypothetical protein